MKRYRAAVVGCGRIGVTMESDPKRIKPATHAGAFQNCTSTQLSALVDSLPRSIETAQSIFPGIPAFLDCQQMLEDVRPDIVSICTPPAQHRLLVQLCAQRKVPAIICEKPIAETLEDAQAVIRVCQDSRSLLFINHTRRFDPLLNQVRAEIREGSIGEILHGTAYYTAGLINTGTHLVDLLRFFLGEATEVSAFCENRFSCPVGDKNVNGWIIFGGNLPVALQALEVQDYSIFEIRLYGSKGSLAIDRFGFSVERTAVRDCIDFAGYRELDIDHRIRQGGSRSLMSSLASHVVSCLEGRESPLSRGEDGLAALRILLALKESAERGEKVSLEPAEVLL